MGIGCVGVSSGISTAGPNRTLAHTHIIMLVPVLCIPSVATVG